MLLHPFNLRSLSIGILAVGLMSAVACQGMPLPSPSQQTQLLAQNTCEPATYHTGKPDIQTPTQFGLVLMGGGTDVDEAFKWMIQRSGGGDFVILRASGADGYNDYLYKQLGGLNSVTSLVIDSKAKALCPSVAARIRQAEALFIAGGDQSQYYTHWKNTPVHQAIEFLSHQKKVPVGGTSAGLAILGEMVYTAEGESITSAQALSDPFHPALTLRRDFLSLPLMQGIITDTHFAPRHRQGRLLSFMAHMVQQKWVADARALKGIGIDENTAAVVDAKGQAQILGSQRAWFFRATGPGPEICGPRTPLTWDRQQQAVAVTTVAGTTTGRNVFNIQTWQLTAGTSQQFHYALQKGQLLTRE